jgi:phosphoribosylamine--glycine ligase
MGAYSPAPIANDEAIKKQIYDDIFKRLLEGFKKDGIVYKGIVFAGLMIYQGRAKVIEFNVRFGDPETQCVLLRLDTDLLELFCAIRDQILFKYTLKWKSLFSVCVVLASKGYPASYENHKRINLTPFTNKNLQLIHAGSCVENGLLWTNGGRVMNVCATGKTLTEAIDAAYEGVSYVEFEGCYFRLDIGKKGLNSSSE